MTAIEFHLALMQYCSLTGASVTSYGRTGEHNTLVGGVVFSGHRFWRAADVVYDNGRIPEYRRIVEGEHDHLQPLDWQAG